MFFNEKRVRKMYTIIYSTSGLYFLLFQSFGIEKYESLLMFHIPHMSPHVKIE